jgi:hypothetical protein
MKDYRARLKNGQIIIPVLVCETKLSAALIEAGLLQVNAVDQLKQTHGPRITAHLLYHQARHARGRSCQRTGPARAGVRPTF